MRILVYGAGVLGSLYAARLREAGHDVSILARGRRLAELEEHGIVLEHAMTGERTAVRVRVVERLVPEEAHELVVVLVRKHQLPTVLGALVESGSTSDVLFMLNNASGSQPMVDALGRERVLLGFPSAGGTREGHIVRSLAVPGWLQRAQPTLFGELDGSVTPRLQRILKAFEDAGFVVAASPNMDAWLGTHAATVVPMVAAVLAAGGDVRRLARTRSALFLLVRAIREHFAVLHKLGVPVTPRALLVFERLPEPLLVLLLGRLLGTRAAATSFSAPDADADEMRQLAGELSDLARAASVSTPAADRLREHLHRAAPPMTADARLSTGAPRG